MSSKNKELSPEVASLYKTQFGRLYAYGMPIPEALKSAGYTTTNLAFGLSLLHDAQVQNIIDETRAWIAEKIAEDKTHILQQLDRDREYAYLMENPSAAVAATMAKARIMGLLDPDDTKLKAPRKLTIVWDDGETQEAIAVERRPPTIDHEGTTH